MAACSIDHRSHEAGGPELFEDAARVDDVGAVVGGVAGRFRPTHAVRRSRLTAPSQRGGPTRDHEEFYPGEG